MYPIFHHSNQVVTGVCFVTRTTVSLGGTPTNRWRSVSDGGYPRLMTGLRSEPPTEVAAVFNAHPDTLRNELLSLRQFIYETAESIEGVGPLEETLKWGQPSYLTKNRTGSTIRISSTKSGSDHDYGLYFTCSTNLLSSFKALFGDTLTYETNRALLFKCGEARPVDELRECISMALTYHQRA